MNHVDVGRSRGLTRRRVKLLGFVEEDPLLQMNDLVGLPPIPISSRPPQYGETNNVEDLRIVLGELGLVPP